MQFLHINQIENKFAAAIRNLLLERIVAGGVEFKCKYEERGCHAKLRHDTKLAHERECPFV